MESLSAKCADMSGFPDVGDASTELSLQLSQLAAVLKEARGALEHKRTSLQVRRARNRGTACMKGAGANGGGGASVVMAQ